MKKTLLSWSSGKDSAWTLHALRRRPDIQVAGLFSTINEEFDRVAMHAVRVDLLRRQAACLGLEIELISIPNPCSNADYEAIMSDFVKRVREQGVEYFAFGDLFLEDIRRYREDSLRDSGITAIFPIWGMPTAALAEEMVASGLRARITCVDPKQLAPRFAGREYDASFLADLPSAVDPCGENGEFHSFAFDGPMFTEPVGITVGETISRDGFVFTDLLPRGGPR